MFASLGVIGLALALALRRADRKEGLLEAGCEFLSSSLASSFAR
jgi:2-polyprenyl-6-methoxyphenol hydroxylase-like FAD-dependent oxidoreductase